MHTPSVALVPVLVVVVSLVGCREPPGGDDAAGSSSSTAAGETAENESQGPQSSSEGSDGADESTGSVGCPDPLTDEELDGVAFSLFGNEFDMQPGTRRTLSVGLYGAGGGFEPITDCVRYSVSPLDGATIDPDAGTLELAPTVTPGATYVVEADIESGRRILAAVVTVYTPSSHPLVGQWREVARFDCDTGDQIVPEDPMEELIFTTGSFRATWLPFEAYVDYWGAYEADPDAGTLSLQVQGGNDIPASLDPSGVFERVDEQLVLRELWLGRSSASDREPPGCGHVFVGVGR